MDTKRFLIRPALIILSAGLLLSSAALADGSRNLDLLSRVVRGAGKAAAPRHTRGSATPILSALAAASHSRSYKAPSDRSLSALGDILGSLSRSVNQGYPNYSRQGHSGDFFRNGNFPGNFGYSPGDYRDGHDRGPDRDYASAYRDVGIASAVANMVGVIVSSQANGPVAYQPAPVVRYEQPAPIVRYVQPAPVVRYVQPAGHYERRQVLVREGYYEEYEVRVPEFVDPRTNEVIGGHIEIHRRWVPEVYSYQDVWVPGP